MVNQYHILELANRKAIALFHKDLPFYRSDWNIIKNSNGLDSEKNSIIDSIIDRTTEKIDITYRISFPFRLYGGDSRKIFSFGTSEFQNLEGYIYQGPKASEDYLNNKVKIITPSHWSREGFLLNGYREEDVYVVPHGVDMDIYRPIEDAQRIVERKALKLKNEHFMFLNVGAMTWNKGIDKLLMAFSEINKAYPYTRLVLKDQSNLYGIGARDIISDMKKNYPSRFTDRTLSCIVVVSSNLSLKQLASLYNICDAYISPYRAEGFNLTPLEAAACGVPVALTHGGATDDYFDDSFALGIEGKKTCEGSKNYIEPDIDSLIAVMSDLVEKRGPRINPSEALNYINKNFSWRKVTDKLLDVFCM